MLIVIAIAAALSLAGLGGGLYEYLVVDPFWPKRPDIIQTPRGGISRRRFWAPAHTAFELTLIGALVLAWPHSEVRLLLLVALASHAIARIWSFVDFIPKAARFETADPATFDAAAARRWTQRSWLRMPFALVSSGAMLMALVAAARLG